jgi:hypothetical protein
MTFWLRIDGMPARQFYLDVAALTFLDAELPAHAVLQTIGTARSGTGGETANVTVMLDNRAGLCSQLFAMPPLGARARLYADAAVQFDGVVSEILLNAAQCQLGLAT